MKITLINPPVDFNFSLGRIKRIAKSTKMLPLGIAYIAAILKQNGHDVSIVDSYAEDLTITETVARIFEFNPDVVGISSVTPTVPIVLCIAREIKERSGTSGLLIVAGGAHANIMPESILESGLIDIVIRGEGEATFLELLNAISNKHNLCGIQGISYKQDGKIFNNPNRAYIQDLDSLPWPAYELLKMDLYSAPPHWLVAEPAFQMLISRGCPFKCIFCGIKALGRALRHRSVKNVLDEIEFLHQRYGMREVMFVDAVFPYSKKSGKEFCDEYLKRGLQKKIKWVTETRVDIVDQELLKLMYRAGCRLVAFGLESGSQNTLERIKKGATVNQAKDAIKWAKNAGLDVYASFVIGFPGETKEEMKETFEFIKSNPIDYPKINLLVPYPGSEVYQTITNADPSFSKEWDKFTSFSSMTDNEPVYVPQGISIEELKFMHKQAYREIYLRPKFLINHLKKLNSWINVKKYLETARVFMDGVF